MQDKQQNEQRKEKKNAKSEVIFMDPSVGMDWRKKGIARSWKMEERQKIVRIV
jgi:hypothetical protein